MTSASRILLMHIHVYGNVTIVTAVHVMSTGLIGIIIKIFSATYRDCFSKVPSEVSLQKTCLPHIS